MSLNWSGEKSGPKDSVDGGEHRPVLDRVSASRSAVSFESPVRDARPGLHCSEIEHRKLREPRARRHPRLDCSTNTARTDSKVPRAGQGRGSRSRRGRARSQVIPASIETSSSCCPSRTAWSAPRTRPAARSLTPVFQIAVLRTQVERRDVADRVARGRDIRDWSAPKAAKCPRPRDRKCLR